MFFVVDSTVLLFGKFHTHVSRVESSRVVAVFKCGDTGTAVRDGDIV